DMAAGKFREDLLYRLNVIEVKMPPLREPHADVLPLVEHLLQFVARQTGRAIIGITAEARQAILRYPCPGNVRQLRHAVDPAVILGGTAVYLLHRLGDRVDAILRENYDSVRYMERLKEALERIDSSYTVALVGQEKKALEQYQHNWPKFEKYLDLEQRNITLP